jgi:hypothetical protein
VLFILGAGAVVAAQNPDSYTIRIYVAGAPTPVRTTTITAAQVVCNLVPPTVTIPVTNPSKIDWTDLVNAGRVCLWTDPGTGPLLTPGLASGNYEATLTATNTAGTSAESSPRSPFVVVAMPAVPTAVRVHQ